MPAEAKKKWRKKLKICCGITAIVLIILVVVFVTLFFTVFKPKNPQIFLHPSKLENFDFKLFPFSINAKLGLMIQIKNQNVGTFLLKKSTGSVNYHGNLVAEIPIQETSVPAKGEVNISTYVNFSAEKLISSPYFLGDLLSGHFDMIATANLIGKGRIFKIIKLVAKIHNSCNISIYILTQKIESTCNSKLKI